MSVADALNATLAVEHEALYAYGVLGAHTAGSAHALARSAFEAHRAWRDRLTALVRDAGAEPVVGEAAYALTSKVTGRTSAISLAAAIEDGVAVAWERLVIAAESAALRTSGATALVECATRAARWRMLAGSPPAPNAFPGRG